MKKLKQQMEFILEVDKLKQIQRQTYISDSSRRENDAEHSWHLAIMCYLLKEHANEEIDVLKTMMMVLIHDIVEIDAGDTFAYDEEGMLTQAQREQEAADRIFNLLPKDQMNEMMNLWQEFEAGITPEAKYARALDRIQPIMLNDASNGKSWKSHKIKGSQAIKRNEIANKGSENLWTYAKQLIEKNIEKGNLE